MSSEIVKDWGEKTGASLKPCTSASMASRPTKGKLGGEHDDSNIQLLCPPCNSSKQAIHPIDFMQRKGFLL